MFIATMQCNVELGRTRNKRGNHVMKTVLSCNQFYMLQRKQYRSQDNPPFITGFPCLFPVLPCSVQKIKLLVIEKCYYMRCAYTGDFKEF